MRLKVRFKQLANGYETAKFDIHFKGTRKFEHLSIKWKKTSENCQGAKRASRKIETCSNSG
jgi:hypothetical protein